MSCGSCNTNNINCQCSSAPVYLKQAPSPLSNNCGCSCNCPEIVGTRKIIDSHEVLNNSARAVFFEEGGCDVIAKGYIPSSYNLSSNGPKYQKNCCGESGGQNLESEGMDCLNYVFNQSQAGHSF
jgi:hypothetical protein